MADRSTIDNKMTTMRTTGTINIIAGAWLILSPFFMGYDGFIGAIWNSVIVGILIIIFSGLRVSNDGHRRSWAGWLNAILGLWMILSPYIYGYAFLAAPLWNSIIVGAIVLILAVWNALSTPSMGRMGRTGRDESRMGSSTSY